MLVAAARRARGATRPSLPEVGCQDSGVDGLFDSDRVWIVLPDVEGVDGLRALLDLEAAEIEVELGGTILVATDPPAGAPAMVLQVDAAEHVPRLVRESSSRLLVRGPTLDACETALSLLRTMRRTGATELTWAPIESPDHAIDVVDAEVTSTWPSFDRTEIDWPDLRRRFQPVAGSDDAVGGLQRLVAHLGDGHTNVHARSDVAALPYTAHVVEGRLVMADVAPATPGWRAGIRGGDELLDIDIDDIASRVGAPAHLEPWLVGRRALSGPVGEPLRRRVRTPDGWIRSFTDIPGASTWPHPVEWCRLDTGTLSIRIRRWVDADEPEIDRALRELRAGDRLLVDLRGNAGGSLLAAVAFRRRFVTETTRVGSVRFSIGDGSLTPHVPYDDRPSDRIGWSGRTRFFTDGLTYSASEDAILGLNQFPHIDVVGQPSGGGSGRARRLPLHGTAVLTVSTALTYDHDGRCVEGSGIAVDNLLTDDRMTPGNADRDW